MKELLRMTTDTGPATTPLRLNLFERMVVPSVIVLAILCICVGILQKLILPPGVLKVAVSVNPATCLFNLSAADMARIKHAHRILDKKPVEIELAIDNKGCFEAERSTAAMANGLAVVLAEIAMFDYQASFSIGPDQRIVNPVRTSGTSSDTGAFHQTFFPR